MISRSLNRRLMSVLFLLPLTVYAIIAGGLAFKIFVGIAFGIAVKEWVRMALKSKHKIRDAVVGVFYLFVCFYAFIILRTELPQGMFFTLVLLFGVWASDSAAFMAGKLIGGPKLAPKISPNKTWAGFIGGTIGSALCLLALDYLVPMMSSRMGFEVLPFAPLHFAFMIGAAFTVLGQIGDLGMSFYKRKVGVKDTGTIMPGHGGILDRIDSLLIVTPCFLWVMMELNP